MTMLIGMICKETLAYINIIDDICEEIMHAVMWFGLLQIS